MRSNMDRRGFLRTSAAAGAGMALAGFAGRSSAAEPAKGAPHAKKLGWRLTCAAYSFNALSFYKTLDQVAALGLDSVEAFTWQSLSEAKPQVRTDFTMSAADRKEAKTRLADKGLKLVGCYCNLGKDDDNRKLFAWAKDMGMDYLVAEPAFDAYDAIEKLCQQFEINLAVHNHPKPSNYWNPDVLLKQLQGRGPRLGACCDTGHWVRSGLDPVAMLRKLQGRVISFHLKDVGVVGRADADCVPFGAGKGNIEGILREAKRQGFQGVFGIEYEPYSPQSFANIAQCVAYFDKIVAQL